MTSCAVNATTGQLLCPVCAPQPCPKGYICPQVCIPVIAPTPVPTLTSAGLILSIIAIAAITAIAIHRK